MTKYVVAGGRYSKENKKAKDYAIALGFNLEECILINSESEMDRVIKYMGNQLEEIEYWRCGVRCRVGGWKKD